MRVFYVASALFVFLSSPALAEFSIGQYQQMKTAEQVKTYITGVGKGVFWSNSYLAALKRKPMFCLPDGIDVDQKLIISSIDKALSRGGYDANDYIEPMVVAAFMERYPCK